MITIRPISQQREIIALFPYISEIPFVDVTAETMFARVLLGDFGMLVGEEDGEICGVLIYNNKFPVFDIKGLHAKNQVSKFISAFEKLLREKKYTHIRAVSVLSEKAYTKVTGLKKLWSVYGKEL